jgi:drug/metabolite transporter (DMT)-like permease
MDGMTGAVVFGLASAIVWGAADFTGGFATKRSDVFMVIALSQVVGGAFYLLMALLTGEALPESGFLLWSVLASLSGMAGLVIFYSGLASGQMGVIAPITGIMTGAVPVVYSLLTEGLPTNSQMVGFAVALGAIWLVSGATYHRSIDRRQIATGLAAGTAFGFFFLFVARMSDFGTYWPLFSARAISVTIGLGIMLLWRRPALPQRRELPVIAGSGVLDAAGNLFFSFAVQAGRLDVATVLSSLYPAGTVLLARLVLKESISRVQWVGVGTALVAVALITV